MAASVGITPAQFWRLTPRELSVYVQGVGDRHEREMGMLAWLQANIMNMWVEKGKPKIRPESLWRRRDAPPEFADAESFNAYMRERLERQEEEG